MNRRPVSPDPWQGWRGFGILLLGGLGLVFIIEIVQLARSLFWLEEGRERGAIWAMLLMILAVFVAVLVIGGGLLRAIRRQGRGRTRLLFVCVENACRSQMAEAFARRLGGSRVEAHSAGSRPSGRVNPRAIALMGEAGYDLSGHRSKAVDELAGLEFDAVISMGCGDACPQVPTRRRLEWEIPDPKDLPDEEFRSVRDRIEGQVRDLLSGLAVIE
ncbi:MAG: arsenate reductase ArsC [Gemmatimonadota bacterium]